MKKVLAASFLALSCALPSSCGTVNTVRWTYGYESCFDAPSDSALRPVVGIPLILGGVVFDAVTWPGQALFGVWPWWGDGSLVMKPNTAE